MDSISLSLVVYFEEPFYVGVLERVCGGRLTACRHVFGAEPSDAAVWVFLLTQYDHLKFNPAAQSYSTAAAIYP